MLRLHNEHERKYDCTMSSPNIFDAQVLSPRLMFSLLRCVGFQPKAQIQIASDGIRVTVDDSHVTQGHVFIASELFEVYHFNSLGVDATPYENNDTIKFGISLATLIECLQVFSGEASQKWHSISSKTERQIVEKCRLSYTGEGAALRLVLQNSVIDTTCDLVTYETEYQEDINLAQDAPLALKIIMQASWLYDAAQELDGAFVEHLIITAGPQKPYFSLSAAGHMGSTIVEFSNDSSLLETFQAPKRTQNTYKFNLIKNATKAMAIASKVSIRSDRYGVLSMQFMVEHGSGATSFVDFRFLPYAPNGSDNRQGRNSEKTEGL